MVERTREIRDLGPVRKRLVAVRAPRRNIKHATAFGVEFRSEPRAVRRRIFSQIDDRLVDFAARAPEVLGFGVRLGLPVQPADRST